MTLVHDAELRLLIQADVDGELDAARAAALAAHAAGCAECRSLYAELRSLRERSRAELPRHTASPALRARLDRALSGAAPPARRRWRLRWPWLPTGGGFVAGAALAAVLLLMTAPPGPDIGGDLLSSHLRALQPGHLIDVASSNRHTVKPWFDGRLDYSPPVQDLASDGFPLIGGRLDDVAGKPVAVLVYRRARHIIDLYVWPTGRIRAAPATARNGYNFVHWAQGGMTFWAVSDVELAQLQDFARLWQHLPAPKPASPAASH